MRVSVTAWALAIAMFTQYLRAANKSKNTIRLRVYYLGRLARELPGTSPWDDVTMDDLTAWLANPDWGPEARKSARASIVAFYRWGVLSNRIKRRKNPARDLPTIDVPRALPRPAPDIVFAQALLFADDKERLMLMLAGYSGARRAEIAKVHLERDLDWEQHEIILRGKGGVDRPVPMHPELEQELRAEIARREAGGCGTGWRYVSDVSPTGYLFPGKHGHVIPDTVGRILDRLLAGRWTAHTLRHRFATAAYAEERDLRAVQELLGHSKPETTAKYVRTPPEAKRAAVLAVGVRAA